jgi:ASC-1-like (ASCH) protein
MPVKETMDATFPVVERLDDGVNIYRKFYSGEQ